MTRKTRTPGAADHETQALDAILNGPREPSAPAAAAAPSGLPNAIDIDAKTITGPVLTNQGWVCPDDTDRKPRDVLRP